MAYYAFVNDENIVTEVITGKDETEIIDGMTPEQWYGQYRGQRCLRTSYNTYGNTHIGGKEPFRGNYASVGYTYREDLDAFIAPKPDGEWTLDETTCLWVGND